MAADDPSVLEDGFKKVLRIRLSQVWDKSRKFNCARNIDLLDF